MMIGGAIWMGLLGSLHCIGMCGPIALALPIGSGSVYARLIGVLLYNLGRIITYALLGVLFGALGKGFAMAGLQRTLSIALGSLILLFMVIPARYKNSRASSTFFIQWGNKIKTIFIRNLNGSRNASLLGIGLVNGFLPCGLVYLAMTGATATGSMSGGAAFMALFGIGTLPFMLTVSLTKDVFSLGARTYLRKAVPYFISMMAILLVLRGLNLGIPYVSPKVDENKNIKCCVDKNCKK